MKSGMQLVTIILDVMTELNQCPRNDILGDYLKCTEIALLPGKEMKYKSFRSSPRFPALGLSGLNLNAFYSQYWNRV